MLCKASHGVLLQHEVVQKYIMRWCAPPSHACVPASQHGMAGCRNSSVFLPHSPGNVGDVASQIRNGFMQANAIKKD